MLLDGVANESAIVDYFPFCSCDSLTGSIYIYILLFYDGAIYWACAGIKKMAFITSSSFYTYIFNFFFYSSLD